MRRGLQSRGERACAGASPQQGDPADPSQAISQLALCQQAPTNKPWLVRRRNARSLPTSSNQQALARPPSQRALSANKLQPTSPGSSAVATRALCQQAPTNKPWLVRRRNARSLPTVQVVLHRRLEDKHMLSQIQARCSSPFHAQETEAVAQSAMRRGACSVQCTTAADSVQSRSWPSFNHRPPLPRSTRALLA